MVKKQTRARSFVNVYLKETGLINKIGSKRWNEFLEDVYLNFKKNKVKMIKSKSEGDLCVVKDLGIERKIEGEIEGKLVYNKKRGNEVRVDDEVSDVKDEGVRMDDDRMNDEEHVSDKELKEPSTNNNTKSITNITPHPSIPDLNESYYNNGYLQSIAHPFFQLKHPPLETPYLFKPKIKREEIDLRIQAVFGLLKLKKVKK